MKHKGAGILYTDGKKVLLLYRAPQTENYPLTWASAGGHIEDGEDLLHAAERESKEEIGVVKGKKITGFLTDSFVMFIFKVDKPFEVNLNDEHTKAEWVKLNDVKDYKLHPNFKKEWPKYLRTIEKNNRSFGGWLSNKLN